MIDKIEIVDDVSMKERMSHDQIVNDISVRVMMI
jgi:hypothetical protein